MDKESGLIHSVAVTPENVHDLTPVAELLHGEKEVVYGDARYQAKAQRAEMADKTKYSGWQCDPASGEP